MKRIQQHPSRQICRRIAATLLASAAILLPLAANAESERGKMFRMWVNDDADKSNMEGTDVCVR